MEILMARQYICKHCGKVFYRNPSRIKWGRAKYCSKECQYKSIRKPLDKRVCPVCKKEFEVMRCIEKRFCSPACSYKARGIGLVKRVVTKAYKNAGTVAEWRKKRCIVCNTDFIARNRKHKICSRECYKTVQGKRMQGENNYFYRNGNSKNKKCYRGDNWNIIRRKIYKRDNWKCLICGKHCSRKEIQCHHIVPYKQGGANDETNLVTLCNVCHAKVEQDRKQFDRKFFQMRMERMS
ncbi:MAG: HNH endonuclease [Nitrospira sp.]|nr:HNH endonuclease [Nitrospira sp.]